MELETPIINEDHCVTCKKTQSQLANPLKHCAKCKTQQYCSRECQKSDWKKHKKTCGKEPNANASSSSSGPRITTSTGDVFSTIAENCFFDGKPEAEAFAQIIDSYRLRVEDEYTFMGETRGLYNEERPPRDFNKYLDKAERKGVLPEWWNAEKRRACVAYGLNADNWSDLKCAVEKADIIKHYGNSMMPMHLRMVAEEVEGSNLTGEPAGSGLRRMMSLAQAGQGSVITNLDMSGMFRR